jgi:hypothetical protein
MLTNVIVSRDVERSRRRHPMHDHLVQDDDTGDFRA